MRRDRHGQLPPSPPFCTFSLEVYTQGVSDGIRTHGLLGHNQVP